MTDTATEQPPKRGEPGGKPRKCTRQEAEERVDFVARLVSKNLYRSEIQKAFVTKYGETSSRQVEEYTARARKLLKKHCNMTREEARDLALVNLMDILRSGKPAERNRALELWVKVHGLEAPTQVELNGNVNMAMKFVPLAIDPKLVTGEQEKPAIDIPAQVEDAK